jgi:hypothetical protein
MSKLNGDKSRYNRKRKEGIRRRVRTRELCLADAGKAASGSKPGASPAAAAKP